MKKGKPTALAGGKLDLGREQALLSRFFQAMQLGQAAFESGSKTHENPTGIGEIFDKFYFTFSIARRQIRLSPVWYLRAREHGNQFGIRSLAPGLQEMSLLLSLDPARETYSWCKKCPC